MSLRFHIHQHSLSATEFVQYVNTQETFECLDIAQNFVESWLNNKQFFDQKTSGSTGKPTVHQIAREHILASAHRTVSALSLHTEQKALVCINMGYIGGKMMLARGLMYDWRLTVIPPTSFSKTDDIPEGPFSFAAMVPLQIENLLTSERGKALLNSIDTIIVGGASTGKHLIKQLQGLHCKAYATYGMTETVSHIALQSLNGHSKSEYFHLLPGVASELDDRNCLRIKADVTNNEWIQTNDVVHFHTADQFKILGRADNVINSGGVKIQAEQLEEKLAPILNMLTSDFAVTSKSHQQLGQKLVLVCEGLQSGPEELMNLLRSKLTKFEVPKEILTSTVPKTPTGKIDRRALQLLVNP